MRALSAVPAGVDAGAAPRAAGEGAGADIFASPLPFKHAAPAAAAALLVAGDLLAFGLCAWLVQEARLLLWGPMPHSVTVWSAAIWWLASRFYERLYPGYGMAGPDELRRTTLTTLVAGIGHAAILFALKGSDESRFLAVGTWALLLVVSWPLRTWLKGRLVSLRLYGCPVVVIGGGPTGALAVRELRANPSLGFVPVAVFDDDLARHGSAVEGIPVVGSLSAAVTIRYPYSVQRAIFAIPGVTGRAAVHAARLLARRYPHLTLVPDLVGLSNLWVSPRPIGTVLGLEVQNALLDATSRRLKRFLDRFLGVPLFLASLPVIAVAALAVKLLSPGPAFFAQEREGYNGKPIRVWKVRTMVPDAEARLAALLESDQEARAEWERSMKLTRDPRLVPLVGAFLRRFSLDELPQFWNVVKGEMSLVGPRPFPEYHLRKFSPDFRELRREVPAGITGLWQVTDRSDGDLAVQEAADSYYIRNWSLWLDLWILAKTLRAVVMPKGAY